MTLSAVLRNEGAVFRPGPAELPLHFGDWHAEYAAWETSACVFDPGRRTQIEVLGPDRAAFVHRLCSNQVLGRQPGSGCEAFFLDAKGHVLAFVRIFVGAESLWLETAPGQSEAIVGHLAKYVVREQVEFCDRSHLWHPLRVAGRGAQDLLERLLGGKPPDRPLEHARGRFEGLEVAIACLRSASRPCWQLVVPQELAGQLWSSLRRAGAMPCGWLAAEAVRIEYGEPEYGVDITAENLPQEVGRNASAISATKGCYLGQEVVARIDSRGHVNRRLVGLVLSTDQVPDVPAELVADGQFAGRITSAAFSPGLGATVGLGYVRRQYWEPGCRLECPLGPVEVAALPLRP